MIENETIRRQLDRVQRAALIVGVLGLVACGAGAALGNVVQFFRSYLVAYLFWLGLGLGSLAILMIHFVAGGRWGFSVRRLLEAAAGTLPLLALLFVPIVFGLKFLYIWTHANVVAADENLRHKALYLNVPFFLVRAAVYFLVWIGLAFLLARTAKAQDENPEPRHAKRLAAVSAFGLIAYGLTMTFAAFDWGMSLEPHWVSTIYGVLLMTGQVLTAFAFVILVATRLLGDESFAKVLGTRQLHDLGNFLLTFVIFWAYIAFSQFLITWAGNLPEETVWYIHRFRGGWGYIGLAMVVLHFLVPFLLLLSRDVKRNPRSLAAVAVGVLVVSVVDLYWQIAPGFARTDLNVHWLDGAAFVGVGGLWVAAFAWQLKQRSLVPVHDARVEEELQPI